VGRFLSGVAIVSSSIHFTPLVFTELLDVYIQYMEYVEGVAQNLPRVLFVHGAGREVIRFAA